MKDKTPYLFGAVFGAFALLLVAIGARNIVQQHTVIKEWHSGSTGGPPDRITEYNGFGAIRIGLGEMAGGVLIGGLALIIFSFEGRRQGLVQSRKLGMLIPASLVTMAFCFFPPWQMISDHSVLVFYLVSSAIIIIMNKEIRKPETCKGNRFSLPQRIVPASIISVFILSVLGLHDIATAVFAALFISAGLIIYSAVTNENKEKSGEPSSAGDSPPSAALGSEPPEK